MKPFEINIVTDGGPWVEHDYPCPVYSNLNGVYDMDKGIFKPSWVAQKRGWNLVHADTWLKRIILKYIFKTEEIPKSLYENQMKKLKS